MEWSTIHIPVPLALAIVATIGYLVGCGRKRTLEEAADRSRREVRRAQLVAAELEKIASELRRCLVQHHTSVSSFRNRIGRLDEQEQGATWKELCREAEQILKPTLQLAGRIASAYDEIRQQSANLMSFTEVRTDPLTGVHNRRGLDEALVGQFAMMHRYDAHFSVAMFDIDHFKALNDREGHLYGDRILRDLANLLNETVRETDVVARYGGEEFVVIMPQTDLEGACLLTERLRAQVEQALPIAVSGGVTEALDGDTQDTLLARTDEALYEAKKAGRNRVYRHTGEALGPVVEEVAACPV
jgi:diguanylate cyclase (GGDEF)-like protein